MGTWFLVSEQVKFEKLLAFFSCKPLMCFIFSELLEGYSKCRTASEVISLQQDWLERERSKQRDRKGRDLHSIVFLPQSFCLHRGRMLLNQC